MNINMKLYLRTVDFNSADFDTTNNLIWSMNLKAVINMESFIDNLHRITAEYKNDWFDIDYEESINGCFVRIYLVFTSIVLNQHEKNAIDKTSSKLQAFMLEIGDVKLSQEAMPMMNEKEGYYFSLKETDGSGLVNAKEIEEYLIANNIKYKRVCSTGKITECGASGFVGTVLIFVTGAIASGITWDLIKKGFSNFFDDDAVEVNVFEDFNYNMMLNIISNRTKIDVMELALTEMYKRKDEIIIQLKTDNKDIVVITDLEYNISELKVINI